MRRNQKVSPLKFDEIQKGRPTGIRSLFPEIVNINRAPLPLKRIKALLGFYIVYQQ